MIFDRPKSGFVRATKYLAGHQDRTPAVRYFEPWDLNWIAINEAV